MAGDQFELLILAAITFGLMVVLGVLKFAARKSGLDKFGRRGLSRRVIRARTDRPTDDERP